MAFIVATYVYASNQGQRTHSARTNSGHLRLCQQPRAAHALRSYQKILHCQFSRFTKIFQETVAHISEIDIV